MHAVVPVVNDEGRVYTGARRPSCRDAGRAL